MCFHLIGEVVRKLPYWQIFGKKYISMCRPQGEPLRRDVLEKVAVFPYRLEPPAIREPNNGDIGGSFYHYAASVPRTAARTPW